MLAAVGQMGSCGVGWDTDSSGPNSGAQHRTWRVARRGGGRGHLPQHLLSGSSAALHEPGPPHRPGTAPPYQHPVTGLPTRTIPVTGPPAPDLPLPPCRLLPSTPGSALLVPARPVPFRSADGGARWPEVAGRWHRDALRCTPVRWRPAMQDETLPDVPLKKKTETENRAVEKRALFRYKTSPSPAASPSTDPPSRSPRSSSAAPGPGEVGRGIPGPALPVPPRPGAVLGGGDAARGQFGAGTPRRSRPDRFQRAGAGLRPPHPVPPPPVAPSRRRGGEGGGRRGQSAFGARSPPRLHLGVGS